MKTLTLAQAAALVVLTVYGAYASHHDATRTAPDPACLTEDKAACAR